MILTALMPPTKKAGKGFSALLICACALAGCTTFRPPQISYDDEIPPLTGPSPLADDRPRSLHVPPPWSPARGGKVKEAKEPIERIDSANDAARVQPRKAGYFNAVQVFPYSPGALYQIYAAPGQITDIALEPGEQLIGSGPVAAGDTVRWVIGDTESGSGETRRVPGRTPDRDLRQPGRVRSVACASGMDPPDHAQWPIDRAGASARRRRCRLCRS